MPCTSPTIRPCKYSFPNPRRLVLIKLMTERDTFRIGLRMRLEHKLRPSSALYTPEMEIFLIACPRSVCPTLAHGSTADIQYRFGCQIDQTSKLMSTLGMISTLLGVKKTEIVRLQRGVYRSRILSSRDIRIWEAISLCQTVAGGTKWWFMDKYRKL
jgi:hypothetical protein